MGDPGQPERSSTKLWRKTGKILYGLVQSINIQYNTQLRGSLIILKKDYCRTHNVSVCLYIAYIACGSASLYIKTLYFFLTVLALSAASTVANTKTRYDAKIPQFAIFGTRVIYCMCSTVSPSILEFLFTVTIFSHITVTSLCKASRSEYDH